MKRVEGMPIRVVCEYTVEDAAWIGEEIVQGKEIDIDNQDGFNWITGRHPGCVYEKEMSEEDWKRLAESEAIKCGNLLKRLEDSTGKQVESHFTYIIPRHEGEMLEGSYYEGIGLPEVYRRVKILKHDVEEFQKKSPEKPVVKGMPIRVVFTKGVQDDRLKEKGVETGAELFLTPSEFEYFKLNHRDSFAEIEMTEKDWMDWLSREANESAKRIAIAEAASKEKFSSYFLPTISRNTQQKINVSLFDGGLHDAFGHIQALKKDIQAFEDKTYGQVSVEHEF